jgi:hypothetical protein
MCGQWAVATQLPPPPYKYDIISILQTFQRLGFICARMARPRITCVLPTFRELYGELKCRVRTFLRVAHNEGLTRSSRLHLEGEPKPELNLREIPRANNCLILELFMFRYVPVSPNFSALCELSVSSFQ